MHISFTKTLQREREILTELISCALEVGGAVCTMDLLIRIFYILRIILKTLNKFIFKMQLCTYIELCQT